jgi:hypothetical protein
VAINHRPQALANSRPRDQRWPRQLGNDHQAASDCLVCQGTNGWQQSAWLNKEEDRLLLSVRCAIDSSVHPRIEGNYGLPNEDQIAPLVPLGYKRTPRRMEL